MADTVTEDDLRAVIAKLVERAKAGERWAVCELLDRCLGKPMQQVDPGSGGFGRGDSSTSWSSTKLAASDVDVT